MSDDDQDLITRLEAQVAAGELTVSQAMRLVAATTAEAERYDITGQVHAVVCALGANHLVREIKQAEALLNTDAHMLGFGIAYASGYTLSSEDQQVILATIKAITEAGMEGQQTSMNFDDYDIRADGTILFHGRGIPHVQWEQVVSEFRESMDQVLGDAPEPEVPEPKRPPHQDGQANKWLDP